MSDTIGQVTSARALRQIQLLQDYLAGKRQRLMHAEQLSERDASSMDKVRQAVDVQNATDREWFLRWENMELQALVRDSRYASRTRRWFYTRAYQTHLQSQLQIWQQFVKWHVELELQDKYLTALLEMDPLELAQMSWEKLLRIAELKA